MRNVLLVDDHPIVRQGLSRVLASEIPDLHVTEASDMASALDRLRGKAFDLTLLDLSLPDDSGLLLLRRIRQEYPATPVLVISMHPPDQFAHRVMEAGAVGYVSKNSEPPELVRAVRSALMGARYLPIELELPERRAVNAGRHESLSDREYQVLRMIGRGRTVSEIADDLGLSVKTVSTYRARILEKLGLRTSAELIRYALVHRLLPLALIAAGSIQP